MSDKPSRVTTTSEWPRGKRKEWKGKPTSASRAHEKGPVGARHQKYASMQHANYVKLSAFFIFLPCAEVDFGGRGVGGRTTNYSSRVCVSGVRRQACFATPEDNKYASQASLNCRVLTSGHSPNFGTIGCNALVEV